MIDYRTRLIEFCIYMFIDNEYTVYNKSAVKGYRFCDVISSHSVTATVLGEPGAMALQC